MSYSLTLLLSGEKSFIEKPTWLRSKDQREWGQCASLLEIQTLGLGLGTNDVHTNRSRVTPKHTLISGTSGVITKSKEGKNIPVVCGPVGFEVSRL